jgi:hypothetical protein
VRSYAGTSYKRSSATIIDILNLVLSLSIGAICVSALADDSKLRGIYVSEIFRLKEIIDILGGAGKLFRLLLANLFD